MSLIRAPRPSGSPGRGSEVYASSARRCSGEAWAAVDARRRRCASCGGLDLEGEDDDLALGGALDAGLAVGLEAREGRERHLLLPRVLPRTRPRHVGVRVGPRAPGRRVLLEFVGWWVQARRCARVLGGGRGRGEGMGGGGAAPPPGGGRGGVGPRVLRRPHC